jgi:hypothetical protein
LYYFSPVRGLTRSSERENEIASGLDVRHLDVKLI